MSSELGLLEHRTAITLHFEASSARRNQLDSRAGKLLVELRRQTGSAWLVASDRAVLDRDCHQVIDIVKDEM